RPGPAGGRAGERVLPHPDRPGVGRAARVAGVPGVAVRPPAVAVALGPVGARRRPHVRPGADQLGDRVRRDRDPVGRPDVGAAADADGHPDPGPGGVGPGGGGEQPGGGPAVTRAGRIARALTIGYGYQAAVAITGLVLVPFLIGRLGDDDFGRWAAVGQVLGVLGLLDLGVAALLPREVAPASGSAVAGAVNRARWLVGMQTPLVALVAAGVWAGVSAAQPALAGPLAVILAAYVVQFPLRMASAVLTGMQDLTFCAAVQAAGWAVTTATTVGLVLAGWGLYALAAGWAAGQWLICGLCWWRLRAKFPEARPAGGWPGWGGLWAQLRPSLWASTSQVALILSAGTDVLVVAGVLGPVAAVVYSCTVKPVQILTTYCYSIGLTSQPALAQLRAAGDRDRLENALKAVGLATLVLSGAVAIGVAAVNGAFVGLWVGPSRYAGPGVTLLLVTAMLARHLAFTWWNAAYLLGYERRVAL